MHTFEYNKAFSRNIGWVTPWEQQILKHQRIAIAGMGGVGGVHLLTLTRLGITKFNIADFDHFEIHNFNRQVGATIPNLTKPKTTVMSTMAQEINPEIDIIQFDQGISETNIDHFLEQVDIYVDGMDFFNIQIRKLIFDKCVTKNIPFITAGPIGMGVCYVYYIPGAMSVADYFCMDQTDPTDQLIKFALGLCPLVLHRHYLQDPSSINFANKSGPSTSMACNLCAGVVGTEVLKILLHRGKKYPMPYYHVYDAYLAKYRRGKLILGNAGPIQRIKYFLMKHSLKKINKTNIAEIDIPHKQYSDIEKIIDLARWAPSGENTQPWRFVITSNTEFIVNIKNNQEKDILDYNNIPTRQTMGILLETIEIAASKLSYKIAWNYRAAASNTHQLFISIMKATDVICDPLAEMILHRSVNRRPYLRTKITSKLKNILESTLGENYSIIWFDDFKTLLQLSILHCKGFSTRLKSRALFDLMQNSFEFRDKFSKNKLPLKSTNLNPLAIKILEQIYNKWPIYNFCNRYLMATLAPAIESELIPGIYCGAQFALLHNNKNSQTLDFIEQGRCIQNFWLTATLHGLVMQPNHFPQMLQCYSESPSLCLDSEISIKARSLCVQYQKIFPLDQSFFMGRIGIPKTRQLQSRSQRMDLSDLCSKK